MRKDRLFAAFSDDSKVVEILQKLLVITDRQDHGRAIAMCVGKVLQGLTHRWQNTPATQDVENVVSPNAGMSSVKPIHRPWPGSRLVNKRRACSASPS